MDIHYTLLDPTGNVTVLVSTPVPIAHQPAVGAALLRAEPSAEQVGFLSPGENGCDLSLRMAGGEFCGNAAMSAAVWWCENHGRPDRAAVRLTVSGAQKPVEVDVLRSGGLWQGEVHMPPAGVPQLLALPLGEEQLTLPVVDMGGIRHVILTQTLERSAAEAAIRRWCDLLKAPALGLMALEERSMVLTPLVYVPSADTLYWEHSCASGTTAAGCWLAWKRGNAVMISFLQPGGVLEVTAFPNGRARLRGRVAILRQGTLALPL